MPQTVIAGQCNHLQTDRMTYDDDDNDACLNQIEMRQRMMADDNDVCLNRIEMQQHK
jgi:hypothetical protein